MQGRGTQRHLALADQPLIFLFVIKDVDPLPTQIDLHPRSQARQGRAREIRKGQGGEFAGVQMDLEQLGLLKAAKIAFCAAYEATKNGRQPLEVFSAHPKGPANQNGVAVRRRTFGGIFERSDVGETEQ